MSGLDFQRKLPESGITIPIIFITGHGDIQMSVRAMKAGAIEFLTKPFRDQDLLDAIHAALENDRESRRRGAEVAELQTSFETLTPRERQVFPLVISGLLNKQIAGRLGISEAPEGPPQPAHAQDAGGVLTRFSVDGREIGNPDAEVSRKLTKVKLLLSNAQWIHLDNRRYVHFDGVMNRGRACPCLWGAFESFSSPYLLKALFPAQGALRERTRRGDCQGASGLSRGRVSQGGGGPRSHRIRVASASGRLRQSDRTGGTHRKSDSHAIGRGRSKAR